MLRRYYDRKNRCACFADPETGLIEHSYRGVKTKTQIPIGGEYSIERDETITTLRRTQNDYFEVEME